MWKAKLISVEKELTIQYYETVSGETLTERYDVSQFASKAEAQAFVTDIVAEKNQRLTRSGQLTTALAALIDKDIA